MSVMGFQQISRSDLAWKKIKYTLWYLVDFAVNKFFFF